MAYLRMTDVKSSKLIIDRTLANSAYGGEMDKFTVVTKKVMPKSFANQWTFDTEQNE